jgi:uncharacterized protein (DUF2062 family)
MIHLTRSLVRKWLGRLLHIHDSPRRTAAAYAVGVFFSFSPAVGLHTVLALIVAFVFHLNRVAVIIGVYTNLPWFMAPYYTLTTVAAAEVMGVALPPHFSRRLGEVFALSLFGREFWAALGTLLSPLVWPFTLGSLAGSLVLGAAAFVVARPFIETGRNRLRLHAHPRRHPPEAP